jgi:hypothetical protein
MSSGRRIVVDAMNFELWCFYRREFYLKKDINAASKKNLNAPHALEDLPRDEIEHFFERQAVKIACRNLIPLAVFDESDIFLEKLEGYLGFKQIGDIVRRFRGFAFSIDFILTQEFEALVGAIELDPSTIVISKRIADLMRDRYSLNALQLEIIC